MHRESAYVYEKEKKAMREGRPRDHQGEEKGKRRRVTKRKQTKGMRVGRELGIEVGWECEGGNADEARMNPCSVENEEREGGVSIQRNLERVVELTSSTAPSPSP